MALEVSGVATPAAGSCIVGFGLVFHSRQCDCENGSWNDRIVSRDASGSRLSRVCTLVSFKQNCPTATRARPHARHPRTCSRPGGPRPAARRDGAPSTHFHPTAVLRRRVRLRGGQGRILIPTYWSTRMDHGMDFMCVLYLSVPCASRCQTTDVTLTRLTRHGQSLVALSRPGLTTHELRHSPLLL
jgi:hypothetical protein